MEAYVQVRGGGDVLQAMGSEILRSLKKRRPCFQQPSLSSYLHSATRAVPGDPPSRTSYHQLNFILCPHFAAGPQQRCRSDYRHSLAGVKMVWEG